METARCSALPLVLFAPCCARWASTVGAQTHRSHPVWRRHVVCLPTQAVPQPTPSLVANDLQVVRAFMCSRSSPLAPAEREEDSAAGAEDWVSHKANEEEEGTTSVASLQPSCQCDVCQAVHVLSTGTRSCSDAQTRATPNLGWVLRSTL